MNLIDKWVAMQAVQRIDSVATLRDGDPVIRMSAVEHVLENLPETEPDTTTHDSIPAETGENDGDGTSGDCISRQQAFDALHCRFADGFEEDRWWNSTHVIAALKGLPAVQPERKTGRWIESNPQNSKLCRLMTCSECGKAYIVNINVPYEDWTEAHKFCVECGTKMEGGEQK